MKGSTKSRAFFLEDIRMNNTVCCKTGKICYTHRQAQSVISHAHPKKCWRRRCNSYGKNVPTRAYYCEECESYHVTHETYELKRRTHENNRRIKRIKNSYNDFDIRNYSIEMYKQEII